MARTRAAFKVLELRGLGTAGVRNDQPKVPPMIDAAVVSQDVSTQELLSQLADQLRGDRRSF